LAKPVLPQGISLQWFISGYRRGLGAIPDSKLEIAAPLD
jgi:hypothetical protein